MDVQYQIRFLGYKGVVAVDEQLDLRKDGIQMCLRPSMNKFQAKEDDIEIAPIEIAQAFEMPNTCYLNRFVALFVFSYYFLTKWIQSSCHAFRRCGCQEG